MKHLIQPYHPDWPVAFRDLKTILLAAMDGLLSPEHIQHVGSTAIPGLPAKPIIDIDIILPADHLLHAVSENLEKLGYQAKGEQGIEGRFAFRPAGPQIPLSPLRNEWPLQHLYMCYPSSLALRNHLLFRDALLQQPAILQQYAALKNQLVKEGLSREQYNRQKTGFILQVLRSVGMDEQELATIAEANR